MNAITLTAEQVRLGSLAAASLGKGKSTDADLRAGFAAIGEAITQGADAVILRETFGLAKNNATLAKAVLTLVGIVDSEDADGMSRVVTQVNYLAAKGMAPVKTANEVAKDKRYRTLNALADALAGITGEQAEGKQQPSEKSEAERFALLVAAVGRHARKYNRTAEDVAMDILAAIEAGEDTDAAADEAAMAS